MRRTSGADAAPSAGPRRRASLGPGGTLAVLLALAACGGTTTEPVASPAPSAATTAPNSSPAPDAVVQRPGCDLSGLPPRTAALTTLTADGALGALVDVQPTDAGAPDPLLDATSYYAEADGAVRAYDAASGRERWSVPTRPVDALWLADGAVVALVDRFGDAPFVLSLDATSGEERWRYPVERLLGTQALTGDGGLAWVLSEGFTEVLDLADGTLRWSNAGPPGAFSFSVAQGVVVRGLRGAMTAYDSRTGEVRWTAPPGGAPKGWGDVVLQEGAPNDAPRYDGWVAAYDAATGTRLWRFDTGPSRVAARGPAGVLLAQKSGYRLVARDGTVRFAARRYVSIGGRASVGVDDVLVTESGVGGSEVGAVVSRAPDGTERWRAPVRIGDPLLRLGGTVVVLRSGLEGTAARGYDGRTGQVRWTRTTPTPLAGTAVLGERAVLRLSTPAYGCAL